MTGRAEATTPVALDALPSRPTTRFAPAPTGYLHLGHVTNAIWVWGLARTTGGRVLLRIEDHDRVRYRPEYDAALTEDLAWLGFVADLGPVRQSDDDRRYVEALAALRMGRLVYGCDCARSKFAAWASVTGRSWRGPGCPGQCAARGLDGPVLRVALGDGTESWVDAALGAQTGVVARGGDLPIRDRHGNWTYGFSVVVDDLRQGIDLVVRGLDLRDATAAQIRLGRLLGREAPPTFVHHPLVRRPDGRKLSKSSGDTAVRELKAAGWTSAAIIGDAAARIRLVDEPRPISAHDVADLFGR